MAFNVFDYLGGLYDTGVSKLNSLESSIGGAINSGVSGIGSALSSFGSTVGNLSANISGGKPPTFSSVNPTTGARTVSGTNQSVNANPSQVVNPLNQSVNPAAANVNTQYGPGIIGPDGRITLVNPNDQIANQSLNLPNANRSTGGVPNMHEVNVSGPGGPGSYEPANPPSLFSSAPFVSYAPTSGFSGFSLNQFPTSSPASGIAGVVGGASLLPTSFGDISRTSGASTPFLPSSNDEKKKKAAIVSAAQNNPNTPFVGPFDSILKNNPSALTGNISGAFGATNNQPALSGNTQIDPNAVLNFLRATGTAPGSFQGGSTPINGGLSFQNGMFGTTNPATPGIQINGGGNTNAFTPFRGVPLSQNDQNIISNVAKTNLNTPTVTPNNPTTKDFSSGASGSKTPSLTFSGNPADFSTKSSIDQAASGRFSQIKGSTNQINQQYAQQQVTSDAASAVSKFLNNEFSPEQIQQIINNPDPNQYPDVKKLFNDAYNGLYQQNVDPTTGQYYNQSHFTFDDPSKNTNISDTFAAQIKNLQDSIDSLKATDPFGGKTIESLRDQYMKDTGVTSQIAQRDAKQADINALYATYKSLADEVKDNPDFSKTLKSRRLDYITNKQDTAIQSLQRDVDLLDKQIASGQKEVADKLNADMNDYTIYKDKITQAQSAYNSLIAARDKSADNARTAINTLVTNPNLAKDITPQEISFIQNNGYYPMSLISKIGATAGVNLQTVFYSNPTKDTKQAWGVTKDGKVVQLGGTIPDVSQSSSSGNNLQYKDVYDPTTNQTYRYYFNQPNQPGTVVLPGGSGQLSATDKNQAFLSYSALAGTSKTKDELTKEAQAAGLNVTNSLVQSAINQGRSSVGNFFLGTSTNNSGYTDFSDYMTKNFSVGGGATGGSAPDANTSVNVGNTLHTVISPDGTTKQMYLTSDQITQATSEGYKVQ